LLNLLALTVLVLHHGPALSGRVQRARALEFLGRAALPVFCTHLLLVLLALALFGAAHPARPWGLDIAILVTSFAVLFAVACISIVLDRRAAQAKAAGLAGHGPQPLSGGALR
jgi:peptidoglycan/LPS O-acetylase OafA/YrhL